MANRARISIILFCLLEFAFLQTAQGRERGSGWEKLSEKKPTHNIRRLSPEEEKELERIQFITIPNDKLILIWEHSCIKHLEAGRIQRAREVKETIEWQRANKKGLTYTVSLWIFNSETLIRMVGPITRTEYLFRKQQKH